MKKSWFIGLVIIILVVIIIIIVGLIVLNNDSNSSSNQNIKNEFMEKLNSATIRPSFDFQYFYSNHATMPGDHEISVTGVYNNSIIFLNASTVLGRDGCYLAGRYDEGMIKDNERYPLCTYNDSSCNDIISCQNLDKSNFGLVNNIDKNFKEVIKNDINSWGSGFSYNVSILKTFSDVSSNCYLIVRESNTSNRFDYIDYSICFSNNEMIINITKENGYQGGASKEYFSMTPINN